MPAELLMPALSPTMEEGKLVKWLVEEGSEVRPGDVIAEIETDKATMEIEAVDEGRIRKLLVKEGGDPIKVNTPIATIALLDEVVTQDVPTQEIPEAPLKKASAILEAGMIKSAHEPQNSNTNARLLASPVARRLAREHGLDLQLLKGTGPRGRIVKRDIEAALQGATSQSISVSSEPAGNITHDDRDLATDIPVHELKPITSGEEKAFGPDLFDSEVNRIFEKDSYELVPHDGMRKTLAERLTHAKQTIPHFYLTIDCRLDELNRARKRLNEEHTPGGKQTVRLSVNDFFIKALALALQYVPHANVTWSSKGALYHKSSDIAIAVAVDGGIFTPIIRHAEHKTLSEISVEMKELAARARDRKLAPHEYLGGTTTISNLGMYGIKQFDAVINPPHATILAVGAAERQPVVKDNTIEIGTISRFTLSCDHRVVDGALGADLLAVFKSMIEDPIRMLA